MLPARGRSTIVVDGSSYHWTRGHSPENMWVTVQHAAGKGALLRIDVVGIPLPNDIAEAIRFAVTNGWRPLVSGPMFYLGFTDVSGFPRFVIRTHDSTDYWREVPTRLARASSSSVEEVR